MKKVFFLAAAFAFVAGVSSCKSEYECCVTTTTDLDGSSSEIEACTTSELTKSEAEDVETNGTTTNGSTTTVTKCTKK